MAAARNCVPFMSRCAIIGSIFVSACKCSIGVLWVQPVIILSALFCTVWSFCVLVWDSMGAQAGLAYVSAVRMNCLYVGVSVSLSLPKLVPPRARSVLSLLFALFTMLLM